jgi:hypothetical protein
MHATFDVELRDFRVVGWSPAATPGDGSGASPPPPSAFLRLAFDAGAFAHETAAVRALGGPSAGSPGGDVVFPDALSFEYSTGYGDALARKRLVVEAFAARAHAAAERLGALSVTLHTLATGPVSHALPLRDAPGMRPRAALHFTCVMRQRPDAAAAATFADLQLTVRAIIRGGELGGRQEGTIARCARRAFPTRLDSFLL